LSIYGTFFAIEDERQWMAGLEAQGIKAGVVRDGEPDPEDLDAPYVYQGSHVLPEPSDPRGGSVQLAHVAAHVRYYRENPDGRDEPDRPLEPWVRLSIDEAAGVESGGSVTVLLDVAQAGRLAAALRDWIEATR